MEHATVCIDEIDKISAIVGGKPYVTGINIQQGLLTLIEGERILYPVTVYKNKQSREGRDPRRHREDAVPLRGRVRDALRPGLPPR